MHEKCGEEEEHWLDKCQCRGRRCGESQEGGEEGIVCMGRWSRGTQEQHQATAIVLVGPFYPTLSFSRSYHTLS
jgi:hypothetical protein